MTNGSTTPPYSGAQTSTPITPYGQNQGYSQQNPSQQQSQTLLKDILIPLLSIFLGAVGGYFSSTLTVKSEIAANKEKISVLEEKFNNISSKIANTENNLTKITEIEKNIGIIDYKINNIDGRLAQIKKQ